MTKPTSKLAEQLELEPTEQAYWEYIRDSYINGQISQVRRLFDDMNEHGQLNFIQWLEDRHMSGILSALLKHKIQS